MNFQTYRPLKMRVFVDDITALVKGRNKEVAEMTEKDDERAEGGSGEERPQVVSH